jgi:hypothetical protein
MEIPVFSIERRWGTGKYRLSYLKRTLFETVLVLPSTPAALRRENQGYPLRNFPLTVYNLLS